jgi:hypothetical protein
MKQFKYNEFTVLVVRGEIVEKMPTARKSVMIYEHDAEINNKVCAQTRLYYEKAEVAVEVKQPEKVKVAKTQAEIDAYKEIRKNLFKVARTDMKLVFQNTITNEELEKLIAENKK